MNVCVVRACHVGSKSSLGLRRGGVASSIVFILVVVALLVVVGIYRHGAGQEKQITQYVADGYQHLENNKPVEGVAAFLQASALFGPTHSFYRTIQGWMATTSLTRGELVELIVGSCLVQAYNDFFDMQPSADILASAESVAALLTGDDGHELKQALQTAHSMSAICAAFQKEDYRQVMKDLLKTEKEALKNDLDFFIQEIRVLIACGRAMDEPEILNHARELLFFFTYEINVQNPRIDQLWHVLNR